VPRYEQQDANNGSRIQQSKGCNRTESSDMHRLAFQLLSAVGVCVPDSRSTQGVVR
jgi:hypothetical protein